MHVASEAPATSVATATTNTIRVTTGGKLRTYVSRAIDLLPVRAQTKICDNKNISSHAIALSHARRPLR